MRPSHSRRSSPRARRLSRVAFALAALAGALPAAFAQGVDPALAQLQQQLQPLSDAQLLAPAAASPTPAVQQVQAAPQPLPAVQPPAVQPAPAVLPPVAEAPPPVQPPPAAMRPAPPEPARPRPSTVGPATVAWLDLQRSNRAAAPEAHPFEGAAASSAYQRYLQSFTKPIPSWFTSVQRSSGGGSSGGSDLQSN